MSKAKFLILILILFVILLSAFVFLHFQSSTVISADGREDISFPVTQFRQNDARWSSDKLGTSRYTMKRSGCVTTSIASAVSCGLDEITPGELNKLFSDNGVYDSDGNIQWAKLDALGYKSAVLAEVSEDVIYKNLKNGQFPLVRVRVNGIGNFHYVLIVGIEKGEYICMDSLKDDLTPLSDYLNKVYAVRVVY